MYRMAEKNQNYFIVMNHSQQKVLGIKSNPGSPSLLSAAPVDVPSEGGVTGQAMSVLNWQIHLMFY